MLSKSDMRYGFRNYSFTLECFYTAHFIEKLAHDQHSWNRIINGLTFLFDLAVRPYVFLELSERSPRSRQRLSAR